MTQEEFLQLQCDHRQSGLSLKLYLQQIGTGYSTYNYWHKKYCSRDAVSVSMGVAKGVTYIQKHIAAKNMIVAYKVIVE